MHKSIQVLQGLSRSGLLLCGLLLGNVGVGFAQEAAIEVDQTQQQEIDRHVSALIQALQDSDADAEVRRNVADALGNIGSETAVSGLIQALQDSDAYVRRSVVYALRNIGTERAVRGLIQALQDPDAQVRRSVVYALGNIGTERAVRGLIQALQDSDADADAEVRRNVADALGNMALPGLICLTKLHLVQVA